MLTWYIFLMLAAGQSRTAEPPGQPIPFSHKTHASAGLVCKTCHANADPGEFMGIPPASQCMGCHRTIAADRPAIEKLARFVRDKQSIPWVRVYQIPSYVYFSHRVHGEAGASCETCHGRVAESDVLRRERDISMGACMDCHRRNKASNDCSYCHEPR